MMLFTLLSLVGAVSQNLLHKQEVIATEKTSFGEGEFPTGCEESDYQRYKIIVCNESLQQCANHCEDNQVCGANVEWCKKFVNEYTEKFGSCKEKGC
jgi:hypothetical protein